MTRKELLGETWKPGICSFYLKNVVYSKDSLCHGGIGVTAKFNPNVWGSFQHSFFEWNFTCQPEVLSIIYKEPYGFQLKYF